MTTLLPMGEQYGENPSLVYPGPGRRLPNRPGGLRHKGLLRSLPDTDPG